MYWDGEVVQFLLCVRCTEKGERASVYGLLAELSN